MVDKLLEIKARGNSLYQQRDYIKAINCYEEALTATNYRLDDQRKDASLHKVDTSAERELRLVLLSNLALCYMQLE